VSKGSNPADTEPRRRNKQIAIKKQAYFGPWAAPDVLGTLSKFTCEELDWFGKFQQELFITSKPIFIQTDTRTYARPYINVWLTGAL